MKGLKLFLFVCLLAVTMGAGSGSGSGGGDDGGGGDDSGESDVIDTTAGSVLPVNLVVTSPYESSSSSSAMVVGKSTKDFDSAIEGLQTIIGCTDATEAAFTLDVSAFDQTSLSCYGPIIDYFNHPDGSPADGEMPPHDVGLWNEMEGSEACAAAKINQLVDSVAAKANIGLNIFASMGCYLNLNEDTLSLPGVGESQELTDGLVEILDTNGISGLSVTAATLDRSADDDGNAVYNYAFLGSMTIESETRDLEFFLRHVQLAEDNSTYKGKLSYVMSYEDESGGNSAEAGSVLYHKSSSTELTYRAHEALYTGDPGVTPDPLDSSNFDIDPTINGDTDSEHGWKHNYNYLLASLNPQEDGIGTYAFSWIAGFTDDATRAFNVTLAADDSGVKSGCAYYGYGPRDVAQSGTISGMVCNWAGANPDHTPNDKVQRQCVVEESGVFVTDTSAGNEIAITYAPTNSCDCTAGDDFTYYSSSQTMTNDHTTANTAVINNLIPVSDMDFTMPTAPSDVY